MNNLASAWPPIPMTSDQTTPAQVAAAVMAVTLNHFGASIAQIIGVTALLNAAVAIYIFRLIPTFFIRFLYAFVL